MKNIHVLPTDKPSRICKNKFGTFYLTESMESKISFFKNQNIYITNSEEIKEGDWYIYLGQINKRTRKNPKAEYSFPNYKKIILTTDQDLIKDGVQEIPDEFLEWFVKNPSYEELKIGIEIWNDGTFSYRIIIPKEEPKQETLGYICPTTKKQCDDECCVSAEDCHIEAGIDVISEPKQETLEEVAEKLTNDFPVLEVRFNLTNEEIYGWFLEALQKGAKWQQQQMYSEEEVELIANEMVNWAIDNIGNQNPQSGKKFDEVIAKYKKK